MQHHFDVDLAVKYGMTEAVLLNHFEYWIELNKSNDKNYYEGRYWTFNSMKAFSEIFPYLSPKKIRNALKHLQDKGLILTGNFNRSAYDRTLWYAFSDLAESILTKGQMDENEKANGLSEKGEPIPDDDTPNNPPKKTNNNERRKRQPRTFVPPTLQEVEEYARSRESKVDPKHFYDYFSAGEWIDGKGNPVLNWKQKFISWEKREGGNRRGAVSNQDSAQSVGGNGKTWNIQSVDLG